MIYQDRWTYSYTGEDYDSYEYFDTKEEAIEYVKEEITVGRSNLSFPVFVWIGQIDYEFKPEIDIEMIIEDISLMAYNHSPDRGDNYLEDVKEEHQQELQEELQKALDKWIEKHNYHPNFFTIKNSFYYEVEGVE